jgi:hypothetical protein
LNSKEFMHQAWLDMIKLNAPTHELEKPDFRDKKKTPCFHKLIKMRYYLFKLLMVTNSSMSPSKVSNKIKSADMC